MIGVECRALVERDEVSPQWKKKAARKEDGQPVVFTAPLRHLRTGRRDENF